MGFLESHADDNDRNLQEDLDKLADAFFHNLQRNNCEYGGIGLDDKSPFGNSSSVNLDILEIIGYELPPAFLRTEAGDYANQLYDELPAHLRKRWNQYKTFFRKYAETE